MPKDFQWRLMRSAENGLEIGDCDVFVINSQEVNRDVQLFRCGMVFAHMLHPVGKRDGQGINGQLSLVEMLLAYCGP